MRRDHRKSCKHGANANPDVGTGTAVLSSLLSACAHRGSSKTAQQMLDHGADFEKDFAEAMTTAAGQSDVDKIRVLVAHSTSPRKQISVTACTRAVASKID